MVKAIRASVPNTHVQRMLDLAKQGWKSVEFEPMDTHWQGEGYATVSGQNSNNSVRVPESFMQAVKDGGEWDLYFRTEKEAAAAEGRLRRWQSIAVSVRRIWSPAWPEKGRARMFRTRA